jgi:hypothetical protein
MNKRRQMRRTPAGAHRVGEAIRLFLDGTANGRISVAETGNRCAARRIEIAPAILIDQVNALATDSYTRGRARLAIKDRRWYVHFRPCQ